MVKRALLSLMAVVALCAGYSWFRIATARRTAEEIAARSAFYRRFGIAAEPMDFFVSLPSFSPHEPAAARCGARIYYDGRVTGGKSCGACHPLVAGGTDGKLHGTAGKIGEGVRTRPSVNAIFSDVFLHDGSVTGLTSLVETMICDARFGNAGEKKNLESPAYGQRFWKDRRTRTLFEVAYGESGICFSNVVHALVQYENTLLTAGRAFDRYLGGETNALTAAAVRGFDIFKQTKCGDCHSGPALGGLKFSRGIKVATLRGLPERKTYLTKGEITDLSAAISFMPGEEDLSVSNVIDLIAFLESL